MADENYKPYALCRIIELDEFMPYPLILVFFSCQKIST